MSNEIKIYNASLHNLKNIDLSIKKGFLTVVTGISGSGKSSMIFDILYSQGRRQFIESLGIPLLMYEDTGHSGIEGLSAIVGQKQNLNNLSNPRSVVGTFTGILSDLRTFMVHVGEIFCSVCGEKLDNKMYCKNCNNTEARLFPGQLSFNSPFGMCINCKGKGTVTEVNYQSLLDFGEESIKEFIKRLPITANVRKEALGLLKKKGINQESKFSDLPEDIRKLMIYGKYGEFWGFIPNIEWRMEKKKPEDIPYIDNICPECQGKRLSPDGLKIRLENLDISQLSSLTLPELKKIIQAVEPYRDNVKPIQRKIIKSLNQLIESDLSHLTLYQTIPSLSGGEIQRLLLSKYLNTDMKSVIYIFDEPTSGLHEVEKELLLSRIAKIKDNGNTVIIVEHDRNTIEKAERIVDFGPGAGIHGGYVVYNGIKEGITDCAKSKTGNYFSNADFYDEKIKKTRNIQDSHCISIKNCNVKNLKNIKVNIPLGVTVGVAGVSGSGKSSLVKHSLLHHLKKHFKNAKSEMEYEDVYSDDKYGIAEGISKIDGFSFMGQNPIGRNNRSNIITYIGIANNVRKFFAQTDLALKNGLNDSWFSFNSKGGCDFCKGAGRIGKYLRGVGDVYSTCPKCKGKRYSKAVLEIKYRDKNILDVLDMEIEEAADFFALDTNISKMLYTLYSCGMGYLKLGQPTSTVSGGEAQRLKLACELGKNRSGNILYILDEPTTGLSFHDVFQLIPLLELLVEEGNSVLIVEHDPLMLRACDYIIEMGPGHGPYGGEIINCGTVNQIRENSNSLIGRYLK